MSDTPSLFGAGAITDAPSMHRAARFSPCRAYRYTLDRRWGPTERRAVFVMLNPSTADETIEDPTVRRCIGFARAWGYDALTVLNIFALRSTDPAALYSHPDPVGPENNVALVAGCDRPDVGIVIAAWGKHGAHMGRGQTVLDMLHSEGIRPKYLRLNADGSPGHPLYIPADAEPRMIWPR